MQEKAATVGAASILTAALAYATKMGIGLREALHEMHLDKLEITGGTRKAYKTAERVAEKIAVLKRLYPLLSWIQLGALLISGAAGATYFLTGSSAEPAQIIRPTGRYNTGE